MHVDTVVTVIGITLPLLSFLGLAAVYLRGSADKGTIESLQRSNAALHEEIEVQSRKSQAQDDEIDRQNQLIISLGRQVHTLQGVVTQAAEIARLQTTLDGHHTETVGVLGRILSAIEAA